MGMSSWLSEVEQGCAQSRAEPLKADIDTALCQGRKGQMLKSIEFYETQGTDKWPFRSHRMSQYPVTSVVSGDHVIVAVSGGGIGIAYDKDSLQFLCYVNPFTSSYIKTAFFCERGGGYFVFSCVALPAKDYVVLYKVPESSIVGGTPIPKRLYPKRMNFPGYIEWDFSTGLYATFVPRGTWSKDQIKALGPNKAIEGTYSVWDSLNNSNQALFRFDSMEGNVCDIRLSDGYLLLVFGATPVGSVTVSTIPLHSFCCQAPGYDLPATHDNVKLLRHHRLAFKVDGQASLEHVEICMGRLFLRQKRGPLCVSRVRGGKVELARTGAVIEGEMSVEKKNWFGVIEVHSDLGTVLLDQGGHPLHPAPLQIRPVRGRATGTIVRCPGTRHAVCMVPLDPMRPEGEAHLVIMDKTGTVLSSLMRVDPYTISCIASIPAGILVCRVSGAMQLVGLS
ncbi:hypothetical protein KIPB_000902 [Kipferlia bialata]|uniref:Uncharacterized protein n=1 Tax=Kipferlia bialata TaxID=797122 RepID=A0A9K3CPI5_9EUKA|nr:hypothetical protein KIPB_000902 [Kipferlia bialata]|eukprot:g902.t1